MSVVEDVATLLSTQLGLEQGNRLFAMNHPESSGNTNVSSTAPTVAIYPAPSPPPVRRFTGGSTGLLPAFTRPNMRIEVRSTDKGDFHPSPANTIELANDCYYVFEKHTPNSAIGGRAYTFQTLGEPSYDSRDSRGRHYLSFFVAMYADPST